MIYFHGSKIGGIKLIEPHESIHGRSYVYLSSNKVVACFYTVNAIEVFFERENWPKPDHFEPWFPYGFSHDGIPVLEEYYPNATRETYSGRKGFIYSCETEENLANPTNIPCAVTSEKALRVVDEECVLDIYEALCAFEKQGQLIIKKFEDASSQQLQVMDQLVIDEIQKYHLDLIPENPYSLFLKAKFPHLFSTP